MIELETALYNSISNVSSPTYSYIGAKVYDGIAPESTSRPYCLISYAYGGLMNTTPTDLIEIGYTIKAVADSHRIASLIDSALWARLHNVALSISSWNFISIMREGEVALEEDFNGVTVFHRGAIYRIRVSK